MKTSAKIICILAVCLAASVILVRFLSHPKAREAFTFQAEYKVNTASNSSLLAENRRPTSIPSPKAIPTPLPATTPTSPPTIPSSNQPKTNDFSGKVVIEKVTDLKGNETTPAGKYYKKVGTKLVLGIWDGKNTFTPIDPPQTLDVSKSFPMSLPYGVLPNLNTTTREYIDSDGNKVEEIFDPKSETLKVKVTTPDKS